MLGWAAKSCEHDHRELVKIRTAGGFLTSPTPTPSGRSRGLRIHLIRVLL